MRKHFSGTLWLLIVMLMITGLFFLLTSSSVRKAVAVILPSPPAPQNKHYNLPVKEALKFVKGHKMDTNTAIFINYHQHSGKKRLYIIDLKKGIATDSFLVAHGCGDHNWGSDESRENPSFSNTPESHCSSLGKYKMGKRAYSDWGINVKYLMHGLEATNSNALKRTIVLHGWGDIGDEEPYPGGVPEGWGCPAVSNYTMKKLDALLSNAKGPVLLWAY